MATQDPIAKLNAKKLEAEIEKLRAETKEIQQKKVPKVIPILQAIATIGTIAAAVVFGWWNLKSMESEAWSKINEADRKENLKLAETHADLIKTNIDLTQLNIEFKNQLSSLSSQIQSKDSELSQMTRNMEILSQKYAEFPAYTNKIIKGLLSEINSLSVTNAVSRELIDIFRRYTETVFWEWNDVIHPALDSFQLADVYEKMILQRDGKLPVAQASSYADEFKRRLNLAQPYWRFVGSLSIVASTNYSEAIKLVRNSEYKPSNRFR